MFNIIVKGNGWAEGQDTFTLGRIFEYTDQSYIDVYRPNGDLNIAGLAQLPTLFVQETFGQRDQIARVGTILRGHVNGREVVLEYVYDPLIPPIPNSQLEEFAAELGIERTQFFRTHWSVKSGDLYRALVRNLHPRRNRPTVFQLNEPPSVEQTLVSAMMPFHPDFNPVYQALQNAAQAAGMRCRRADDIWENPAVIQDVVSLIDRSRVVICDCTQRNPNVFYEIGIAHTLGREVILITQSQNDIPFDLRHLRYVTYLNNGEGLGQLTERLQQRLEAVV